MNHETQSSDSPARTMPAEPAHDRGLGHDMQQLLRRRGALKWLAGAGALALAGCGGSNEGDTATPTSSGTTGSGAGTTTTTARCTVIPEETAGPYPGDGSNGSATGIANALLLSGIVRSDIRASIAGATGVAAGVPLVLTLRLVNANGGCSTPLAGYAIYLWHCDREGRYSMYSAGVTDENYLRGVQVTGSDGSVTFTTIFPGCYAGRMPHMHFEIYRSLTTASAYSNKLRTSQLALPVDACNAVYGSAAGYATSAANFARISFATDNVFSDGVGAQLATVSGSVDAGYQASLQVAMLA